MRTLCFALLAYLVLTGCALLWSGLLKLYLAEGMMFAACMVAVVLYAAGLAGRFQIGMGVLVLLGTAGLVLALVRIRTGKGNEKAAGLLSPYFLVLSLLFVCSVVIYFGDFIWHTDEFHLYAASPKYMLESGTLPLGVSYISGAEKVLGTSLFHLFFQMFTGRNEGIMYASAALISWIGMLLPFAGAGAAASLGKYKPTLGRLLLYTGVLYLGLYSLYPYGPKNLYVDIPTVAWAGGLAGWWMLHLPRRKGRGQYLVGAFGIVMITMMKPHIGLLMAALVLGFMCLEEYRIYKERQGRPGIGADSRTKTDGRTKADSWTKIDGRTKAVSGIKADNEIKADSETKAVSGTRTDDGTKADGGTKKRGLSGRKWLLLPAALLVLAGFCAVFAWSAGGSTGGVGNFLSAMGNNLRERIKPITIAFITSVTGAPFSRRSTLALSMPVLTLIVCALFILGGNIKGDRKRSGVYLGYALAALAAYMVALYAAFLFIFNYEESVRVAGGRRYYACILIYLLIMALVWLLGTDARQEECVPDGADKAQPADVSDEAGKVQSAYASFEADKTQPAYASDTAFRWPDARYFAFALLVFFALGINEDFIPNATSLNKPEAAGYKDIKRSMDEAAKVQEVLSEGERVYFLNQDGDNEYPTNVALYNLGASVSNYLTEPWKFTQTGSITRLKEDEEPSIEHLPAILAAGGYQWLWIYESDAYLEENLWQVFAMDDPVQEGLYRVIYTDQEATGLDYEMDL